MKIVPFEEARKGDWLVSRGGDVTIKIDAIGCAYVPSIIVTLAGCFEGHSSQAWEELGFHVEREERDPPKVSRFDIPASEDTFVWKRGGEEGDYIILTLPATAMEELEPGSRYMIEWGDDGELRVSGIGEEK